MSGRSALVRTATGPHHRGVVVRHALVAGLLIALTACGGEEAIVPPTAPSTAVTSTTLVTVPPTTASRTTVSPTTAPTTAPPTSAGTTTPTTSLPTTVAPTTPATSPSTTVAPTTTTTTAPGAASLAVHRVPTEAKVVALTFDAGSDVGNTALVLDVLARYGAAASFGITGDFAATHPDHVRRIAREGHVVMNHSDSHVSFTGVSSADVLLDTAARQADLLAADAVLAPLIGRSTVPFWRPPFGDYDAGVLTDVGAIGYRYTVMWTIDSLGWRGLSAQEITDRVLDRVEPGAIVLMHVGSQSADAHALPTVIDGLLARGYRFTTIANAFPA
jgi:peptidoglycan-N-acetylglucosamine deacetylase